MRGRVRVRMRVRARVNGQCLELGVRERVRVKVRGWELCSRFTKKWTPSRAC